MQQGQQGQQMQQRRTVNNSQYQQAQNSDVEQGGDFLATQPSLYRPTFVEDTLSRSNYVRLIDLVNLFGDILKVGKDTFPGGDFGKFVTGLFKLITEVILPGWKAIQEMVNQGKITNLIILSHFLNAFDAVLSTASAGFWVYGTVNNSEDAYAAEKYLLAAAVCLHLMKDAVQSYEKRKTDEHDSKAKEQRLKNVERTVENQEKWIGYFKQEIRGAGDNPNLLFHRVNSVQREQSEMEKRIATLESRVLGASTSPPPPTNYQLKWP